MTAFATAREAPCGPVSPQAPPPPSPHPPTSRTSHALSRVVSGGPIQFDDHVSFQTALLAPSVDEILRGLLGALVSPSTGGRGKPANVGTDEKGIVARLQEILGPAGVTVQYYPPPSDEELRALSGPG